MRRLADVSLGFVALGVLLATTASIQAAPLYLVNFNQSAGPAPATYTPGAGEILPGGASMQLRGSPTLEAAAAGYGAEGGNAMRTVAGTGSGSQGYAITGGPTLAGSWTAEAIVRLDQINPAGNGAGLQDILNGENSGIANILRVDGSGQIHFYPMYSSGGGANPTSRLQTEVTVGTGRYYHVAARWNQVAEQAELFINGVSQGTLSRAGHTGGTFGDFAVANNFLTAHNPRNISGITDAFAVTADALTPDQFVFNNVPLASYDFAAGPTGAGLFVQPAVGDLVAGQIPTSNAALQAGNWAALTDGLATTGHPDSTSRALGSDSTTPANPWQLTYTLNSPGKIREVRVFTQNPDGRVFQDYDVEVSGDGGDTWSMLAGGVTNGVRGVTVNDWGDAALGDWSATAVRRLDGGLLTGTATHVRLTLREVTTSGGNFSAAGVDAMNSFLYEVDVLGEGTPSVQRTPIGGGFNNPHLGGAPGTVDGNLGTTGYIGQPWPPGSGTDDGGQFGATFDGRTELTGLAITQNSSGGRHRLKDITVHAGNGRSYSFTLDDQYGRQMVMLPQPLETTYLLVTADSQYTTGSTDPNVGIVEFEAFGFPQLADVNQNAGILPVAVGALGGFNWPERATDGVLYVNSNSADNTTFFTRNGGQDSLTVTYPEMRTISSIGLAWGQDSTPGGLRDMPRFVTLQTSEGDFILPIADLIQYARLDLPEHVTTNFARLLFPDGSSLAEWYIHGDANYGLVEFQAFEGMLQTPEPSTLALAGLGLLGVVAIFRRRHVHPTS